MVGYSKPPKDDRIDRSEWWHGRICKREFPTDIPDEFEIDIIAVNGKVTAIYNYTEWKEFALNQYSYNEAFSNRRCHKYNRKCGVGYSHKKRNQETVV